MVVSERIFIIQAIPLSEGYVGQQAESVRAQRSTRVLNAGRMGNAMYGAAVMVNGTLGQNASVFVPNGLFEVGAEKPNGLRGVTRRNREVQIGLRSLSNVVCAWAGGCKAGQTFA
jgi:hypothetical protein